MLQKIISFPILLPTTSLGKVNGYYSKIQTVSLKNTFNKRVKLSLAQTGTFGMFNISKNLK